MYFLTHFIFWGIIPPTKATSSYSGINSLYLDSYYCVGDTNLFLGINVFGKASQTYVLIDF